MKCSNSRTDSAHSVNAQLIRCVLSHTFLDISRSQIFLSLLKYHETLLYFIGNNYDHHQTSDVVVFFLQESVWIFLKRSQVTRAEVCFHFTIFIDIVEGRFEDYLCSQNQQKISPNQFKPV